MLHHTYIWGHVGRSIFRQIQVGFFLKKKKITMHLHFLMTEQKSTKNNFIFQNNILDFSHLCFGSHIKNSRSYSSNWIRSSVSKMKKKKKLKSKFLKYFKFFRSFSLIGLLLIAIGTGGIKPCVSAFGGDQFKLPEQERQLQTFFSVFYFSINAGSLISTFITPIFR